MRMRHPIERLRTHLDLSQADFAEAIGKKQPTISAWEARKRPVPSRVAIQLAKRYRRQMALLGLDAGDLVLGRQRSVPPGKTESRGGSDAARHDEAVA